MKAYDARLDQVPEEILAAANQVAHYARMQGWDKDWAIGPVMARFNGMRWCQTRHFHNLSYNFNEMADKVAASRGQVVVYPGPCEIQLDIDSEDQLGDCMDRIERMIAMDVLPQIKPMVKPSKTPGHYHVTMTVSDKPLTEWQRIALQAVLGSDPMREYLNAMRAMTGVENVTRLFENPESVRMMDPATGTNPDPITTIAQTLPVDPEIAKCPKCGSEEVDHSQPDTMYACGSRDYDQKPGTFVQSDKCRTNVVLTAQPPKPIPDGPCEACGQPVDIFCLNAACPYA